MDGDPLFRPNGVRRDLHSLQRVPSDEMESRTGNEFRHGGFVADTGGHPDDDRDDLGGPELYN